MKDMIVILGGHNRVLKHIDRNTNEDVIFLVVDDISKCGEFDETLVDITRYYKSCETNLQVFRDIQEFQLEFRIRNIVTVSEKYLTLMSSLRKKILGDVRCELLTERFKDKYLMRSILREHGLCDVHTEPVTTLEDVKNFVFLYGTTILKPRRGVGSQSIYKLSPTSLNIENLTSMLIEGEFICEQFIPGTEYSVETMSTNGKHAVIGITQKLTNDQFVEVGHIFPASLPEKWELSIVKYINNVLNIMDFKEEPGHFEVKVFPTDDGISVKLIEGHNRTGGDWITELILLSSGYNIYREIFSNTPTLPTFTQIHNKIPFGIGFFTFYKEPKADFESFWSTVKCYEKELYSDVVHNINMSSSYTRNGHVIMESPDSESLSHLLKSVTNRVNE